MDRVMEGLTELAEFVAARYKDDPGGKHLQSVKRAEIEIERLRAIQSPAPSSGGDLEADPATLRSYCQQLLDLIGNYGVEIDGEDNDLVAHISKAVDPAHVDEEADQP